MSENSISNVVGGITEPPEPKWLFYTLAFFLPSAGVIMAAIFTSLSGAANKEFGRMCLILAVIPVALIILFYLGYILLVIVYIIIIVIFGATMGLAGI